MLASPANQSAGSETQVAENQTRAANIMALEFAGAEHEPVLLSPGKWNIGAASSNQIVLNCEGIAARQFLIIVTEHRSVIKDWSSQALWNGSPFDSTVLRDGDVVEVADTRMVFRLAKSLDLISQLPYVSESDSDDAMTTKVANSDRTESSDAELQNTVRDTADGMLSFDDGEDRLDELLNRIEASLVGENSGLTEEPDTVVLQESVAVGESDVEDGVTLTTLAADLMGTRAEESVLETQAGKIDDELQQLEELRAAVEQERRQLLAKRALLAQESQRVESQLEVARQAQKSGETDAADVVNPFENSDSAGGLPSGEIETVDQSAMPEESNQGDCESEFMMEASEAFGSQVEDQAVAAEREKLRQYLEEFDSVEEAEDEEKVEVAVGAAQAVSENSIMNALRSRDDAVKQLDDLVLAATGGQEPAAGLGSSITEPTSSLVNEEGGSTDSLADNIAADDVQGCEQGPDESLEDDVEAEDGTSDVDAEVSLEKLSTLLNNVENESTDIENEPRESLDSAANDTVMFGGLHAASDSVIEDDQIGIEAVDVETSVGGAEEPTAFSPDCSELASGHDSPEAISSDVTSNLESAVGVEFEDEAVTSPIFGNEFSEECSANDAPSGLDVPFSENAEDAGTPQRLHLPDDIEEQSVEGAQAEVADLIEEETESLDVGSNVSPAGEELFEADLDSEPVLQVGVSDQVDPPLPSWFDSKLISEGDSVDGNDDSQEMSDAEDLASDDGASSGSTESAEDLRQKLADMFDLPALSENTESVAPDSSLESRLNQFREEPAAEESAATGDATSVWGEAGGSEVNEGPADTLDFDLKEDASAEAAETFESETLDEFPSTDSVEKVETTVQADAQASSSFTPEAEGGEEESITAYMERLLARNRQVTGGSSDSKESNDSDAAVIPQAVAREVTSEDESSDAGSADEEVKSEKWLEETPRHSQNRDQVRAEVQKLRQIANQSARSAVATASRRDVRKQVIAKTIASVLSLGSGSAALLLDVSMIFGLAVLGIGLFFSADLSLTVFRNWKQLRDLKKSAASLVEDDREDGPETLEVGT